MSFEHLPGRASGGDGKDLLEEIRLQRGISKSSTVSQEQDTSDPYPNLMVKALMQAAKQADRSRSDMKPAKKSSKYTSSTVPEDYKPPKLKSKKTKEEMAQNQSYIDTFLKYGSSPKVVHRKFKSSRSYIKGNSSPVADMLFEYGASPKTEPTDQQVSDEFSKMALTAIGREKKKSYLPGRVPSQTDPAWGEPGHHDNAPGLNPRRGAEPIYDVPDARTPTADRRPAFESFYHNLPYQEPQERHMTTIQQAEGLVGYDVTPQQRLKHIQVSAESEDSFDSESDGDIDDVDQPEEHRKSQAHMRSEGGEAGEKDVYSRYEEAYDSMENTDL